VVRPIQKGIEALKSDGLQLIKVVV